jgi:hypothetical protein
MPIGLEVWRIDGATTKVPAVALENETRLEDLLFEDIGMLGLDLLMVIGRQVVTDYGARIDLLALDSDAQLHVIELKKGRSPRDVVAQALDYGSWVKDLELAQVVEIFEQKNPGRSFTGDFHERFGEDPPQELAESHQLVIAASELDVSSERIVSYLSGFGVTINVVFFRYFEDGGREYLTRNWLIDPGEAQQRQRTPRGTRVQGKWNGQDFYVSCGEGPHRTWEDWVTYGFVSGGQKRWYSQTLEALFLGARVFAYIPQTGYVGAGEVKETAQLIKDFTVNVDGRGPDLGGAGQGGADVGEQGRSGEVGVRGSGGVDQDASEGAGAELARRVRKPEHGLPIP